MLHLPASHVWPRSFRYFRSGRTDARTKAAAFIQKIDPLAINVRVNWLDGQEMVAVNYIGNPPAKRPKLAATKYFRVLQDGTRIQINTSTKAEALKEAYAAEDMVDPLATMPVNYDAAVADLSLVQEEAARLSHPMPLEG